MINFNEKLLEETLLNQFLEHMGVDSTNEEINDYYLVVESIEFFTEEELYSSNNYLEGYCLVKLRYGKEYPVSDTREPNDDEFCNHITLFINQTWSQDFIKGYFQRCLENIEQRGENE